jgi:hypothetical protein
MVLYPWSQFNECVFLFRSSQLARLGWTMGTPQRVHEMVQGGLGRARHQVHRAGSTYTLTKRQSLPRSWVTRRTTFAVQRVLFRFRIWDVPRRRPRSFPYPNHALDKHFRPLRHKMLSCMISKDISRRTLDQQHVDEQPFPGPSAFLFFVLARPFWRTFSCMDEGVHSLFLVL